MLSVINIPRGEPINLTTEEPQPFQHFTTGLRRCQEYPRGPSFRTTVTSNQLHPPMRGPQKGPNCVGTSFSPFPFMKFPPEIRNSVYRLLLTTPYSPVKFQRPTGCNGARHRAQWAKYKSIKMRRRHKKIFLEILGVCKQVHNEAIGIMYGCNVFKYRSNPG